MTEATWRAIQKKGLLPGVGSQKEYLEKVNRGLKEAAGWLLTGGLKAPSLATAKKIHKMAMVEVAPWAGKPTTVQLITGGFPTCEPRRIAGEFEKLEAQWAAGFKKKDSPQEICRWVAFAAARWLRIHPFADGNKRTISLWAMATTEMAIGPLGLGKSLENKLAGAFKALRTGDLEPLGKILLGAAGQETGGGKNLWKPPHKIAPQFDECPQTP
jgi:fido (protein-threonine AMPylation protein)